MGTKEEKDSAIVKDLNALDATMLERYREAMSRGESSVTSSHFLFSNPNLTQVNVSSLVSRDKGKSPGV